MHWVLFLSGAAYVRLIWMRVFWSPTGSFYVDGDVLYHLRQIEWGAFRFPFLPVRDPFLFFPEGNVCPWPGGFDFLFAGFLRLARVVGLEGRMQEELFANLIVVVLGLLGIVMVVTLARGIWGTTSGWVAGWLAALMPASIDASRFGRIDHHVFEPIILLVGLHPRIPLQVRGLLLGVSVGIAQSSMVPICVVAMATLLSSWLEKRGDGPVLAKYALLAAAPVVAISAYAHGSWFDYRQVGLFQLGVIAIWYFAAETLVSPPGYRRWRHGGVGALLLGSIATPLVQSAGFLETNPVLNLVSEVRSGLDWEVIRTAYLTDNVFLFPFALGSLAWAVVQKSDPVGRKFEVLAVGMITSGLAMLQARFFPLLAIAIALSVGGFLTTWAQRMAVWIERKSGFSGKGARTVMAATLAIWVPLSVARMGFENFVRPSYSWNELTRATYEMLDWVRVNTADPGRKGDPAVFPSYGMMAPWYLGHHVIHVAERPAITTPFLFDAATPGLLDSIRFYFSDTPDQAITRLKRLKVRYVLVPLLAAEAFIQLQVLDRDLSLSHRLEFERSESLVPGSLFRMTMAGKLYFEGSVVASSGEELRLVHEVPVAESREVKIRLFELVTVAGLSDDQISPGTAPRRR